MRFDLASVVREPIRSIVLPADLDPAAVATAADRLRSWAGVRNERVVGEPFVRLHGDFVSFVHVPVAGTVEPHPETGISLEENRGGRAVSVAAVHFADIRAVVRALTAELAGHAGIRMAGPADFVAADARTFASGTVQLPIEGEGNLPRFIALPDRPGTITQEPENHVDTPVQVVTIARQVGSEGDAIARIVARDLGWDYVDYHIVMAAAEEAGVTPQTVERAIHRRPLVDRLLETLAGGALAYGEHTWVSPVTLRSSPLMTSDEFRRLVEEAIADIADRGNVVIVGHGGQFALSGRYDALRVLVTGTPARRAARVMANQGVSLEQAMATLESTDDERIAYFRSVHHEDWLAPANYDLCLNTDRLSAARAAGLVVRIVRASSSADDSTA